MIMSTTSKRRILSQLEFSKVLKQCTYCLFANLLVIQKSALVNFFPTCSLKSFTQTDAIGYDRVLAKLKTPFVYTIF